MRTLMLMMLCFFLTAEVLPQGRQLVQTQESQQKYLVMSTAASDTLTTCKYIVRLVVNSPVASDTIWIYDGTKVVAIVKPPATVTPFFLDYGMRMDSSSVIIRRKSANHLTLIYRTTY